MANPVENSLYKKIKDYIVFRITCVCLYVYTLLKRRLQFCVCMIFCAPFMLSCVYIYIVYEVSRAGISISLLKTITLLLSLVRSHKFYSLM